jgi:hypothetical protein
MTSLRNKASSGKMKDRSFCLMIKPENKAIAMTGEKPDQSRSGPKKNLKAVASATSISVKTINLPLIFIINN